MSHSSPQQNHSAGDPGPPDTIEIRRLRVLTHIGVPDEERSEEQTLWVSVKMVPSRSFSDLSDEISLTVDYFEMAQKIKALCAKKSRKLIETLALEIADFLLENASLISVSVSIEKHILPDTECVAVHVYRKAT